MHAIDKYKVQSSFGRQAKLYESHAVVQKRVVDRFSSMLRDMQIHPKSCLDVGAGSGMLLRSVHGIYGDILTVGMDLSPGMAEVAREQFGEQERLKLVVGDAEHLPFADSSFDLLISTSTFQWLESLDTAFREAFRVLRPGGTFAFSLFGQDTLRELRSSYCSAVEAAGRYTDHTHTFFSGTAVADFLSITGFSDSKVTSEVEMEMHEDVPGLLRALKRIGAGNAAPVKKRGLEGRSIMQEMMSRYSLKFGTPHGIPATYEVIYGRGAKP